MTPIYRAVAHGHLEVVKYLKGEGANMEVEHIVRSLNIAHLLNIYRISSIC